MERKIRLRNKLVLCLCAFLFAGCAKQTQITVTSTMVMDRLREVSDAIVSKDYAALSLRMQNKKNAESELEKAWQSTHQNACQVLSEKVIQTRNGVAELACDQNNVLLQVDFDESLQITSLTFEILPEHLSVESTDVFEERVITLADTPLLEGILTMPKDSEYPPVAILMPEGMSDHADASGNDPFFRKDLAHALAEKGIASVRFHMPSYVNHRLLSGENASFDTLYDQDFARIVHCLEQYPVDASTILYIGHGIGGTMGYYNVMQHFEIDGGLVLLNSPLEDGMTMMQKVYDLSDETLQEVKEKLSDEEQSGLIADLPLSYYQEWNNLDPLRYTRYVTMPIAIFTGSEESESIKESIDSWRSQKGSNVAMKEILQANHTMCDSGGKMNTQLIEDIYLWLNGEDIEEEESDS